MSLTSYQQNHSRSGPTSEEYATSVDVEQWRQDVDTFAATTRQMLDSIHEELSNGLASGQAQVDIVSHAGQPACKSDVGRSQTSDQIGPAESTIQSDDVADECDQLLAKLKAQLSEQLNQ